MGTNAKVPPVQPVTEPPSPGSTPSQDAQSVSASPSIPAYIAEPADYRLVIDKDPVSGMYVYRTVDRMIGETVAQFPNDELVRLRDNAAYKPGTVFNGKA
jgi:flagellar protein FlaG